MQRLPVGGLRLLPELTQLRVDGLPASAPDLTDYLALLDQRRINLFFLTLAVHAEQATGTFCVFSREGDRALRAALRFPSLLPRLSSLPAVCALSVFPHRNSLAPLRLLVQALHAGGVPILALGTSISAVTCVLAESNLPEALTSLEAVFALPQNHTPIRVQLRHEPVKRGEEP